jgi:hypothetical protein
MLARYTIVRELGRGAIAAVYAARDRETGAVVALKRLDPGLSSKFDANVAGRFLKHAHSARLLRHRNIVTIHDAGEAAGTAYVAMEMLEGESLRKILDDGPLRIARAIQIVHDIAAGLAHAHLEGVVHGGLKPSNIIVLRSGVVKITDFGIGQLGQAALLSGARAGCLSYLSPEQLRGDPLDHRCDLFSLGALFYEMLAHRPPFQGDSPKEIMENVLHAELPPPSELNQHVPRALDRIVFSLLARQPVDRMPGAPILLRELQRLEEELGLGSGASAGTDEPAASEPPARHGEARDAGGLRIRADSSAAEEFQNRDRITDREVFDYHKAMLIMDRESRRERSSGSRRAIFAALALVLAVFGIGLAGFMYFSSDVSQRRIAASPMQEAPAAVPGAPQVLDGQAAQASAPNPMPPKPVAAQANASAQTESVVARAPEQAAERGIADSRMQGVPAIASGASRPTAPAPVAEAPKEPVTAPDAPAQKLPRAMPSTAKVPEPQPGGTARLILAVSPRGEIYVDGKHHGTTPPITTLDLEPGMHRIELRSPARKPFLTYMTVEAGDVRRIRHDFNAKPSRPPA